MDSGPPLRRWVLCALALLSLTGCGPALYAVSVTRAKRALQEAEAHGAKELAPYHYYRATAYLEKAQEEAGYSDYQPAFRYSRVARASARQASEQARAKPSPKGRP